MTCIAGVIADDNTVILSADSLASGGGFKHTVRTPKLIKYQKNTLENGLVELGIGYTTSFRFGDILRKSIEISTFPNISKFDSVNERDERFDVIESFLIKEFVPVLQEKFSAGGYETTKDGQKQSGTMLIGIDGFIFEMQDDYSILCSTLPFFSVGSGHISALASMRTALMMAGDKVSKDLAKTIGVNAISIASEFITSVGGPVNTIEVSPIK